LAYPNVSPKMREEVTCDHFLDALGDSDLVFKIRERQTADLDSALWTALQLEESPLSDSNTSQCLSARKTELAVEAMQKEVKEMKKLMKFGHRAPRNLNGGYRQAVVTRYTALGSIANNKTMSILGAARVVLIVAGQGVESEILIAPDLDGLILGINWLRSQGRIRWDFDQGRIKFGKQNWIKLQRETEQPYRTSIILKNFPMANREIGSNRSDLHAAPTGSARRFCCSKLSQSVMKR